MRQPGRPRLTYWEYVQREARNRSRERYPGMWAYADFIKHTFGRASRTWGDVDSNLRLMSATRAQYIVGRLLWDDFERWTARRLQARPRDSREVLARARRGRLERLGRGEAYREVANAQNAPTAVPEAPVGEKILTPFDPPA